MYCLHGAIRMHATASPRRSNGIASSQRRHHLVTATASPRHSDGIASSQRRHHLVTATASPRHSDGIASSQRRQHLVTATASPRHSDGVASCKPGLIIIVLNVILSVTRSLRLVCRNFVHCPIPLQHGIVSQFMLNWQLLFFINMFGVSLFRANVLCLYLLEYAYDYTRQGGRS